MDRRFILSNLNIQYFSLLIKSRTFQKGTLQLLFGISKWPTRWLLHLGPLSSKTRVIEHRHWHMITEIGPERIQSGHAGKGDIHSPGRMKQNSTRFHHAAQKGMQFKMYELLIWGIFHLISLDCGWPRVTETMESEIADKGGLLYFQNTRVFVNQV